MFLLSSCDLCCWLSSRDDEVCRTIGFVVRYREEVVRCCFKISGCLDFDYTMVVSDSMRILVALLPVALLLLITCVNNDEIIIVIYLLRLMLMS